MKKNRIYQALKKTYPFVKPYMLENICSMICLIASSACFLIIPYLIKVLIDDVLIKQDWARLNWFGLVLLVAVVTGNLFRFLTSYLFANFSEKIAIDARKHLFTKLIHYDLIFFQKHQLGDLVSRLRDDANVLHSLFSFIISSLLNNLFHIIFVLIIILRMNLTLGLIVFLSIPIYIWINKHFSKILRLNAHKARQEISRLMNFIYDIFSKVLLIKNFVQEKSETKKLVSISNNLKNLAVKGEVSGYIASSTTQLTTQIVGVIVLYLGGIYVLNQRLTPGSLLAFYTYLGNLFGPILTLTKSNLQINQVLAGVERYFEYLDSPPLVEDLDRGICLHDVQGKISFKNVHFKYDKEPIISNLNLEIAPREKVAILGKSGIGKTTLALLIKRFFEPQAGKILLDDHHLENLKIGQLRQIIGYLTQESYIVNGTIRENLTLGNSDIDEKKIWRALEIAELKDFIKNLPDKLETILENNGAQLSGGQKQRLSIARVILKNPPIVIFDEAFNHLDVETEQKIWHNFKLWLKDKTAIFITHNLLEPDYFDRLILVNKKIEVEGHFSMIKDNIFMQQVLENSSQAV